MIGKELENLPITKPDRFSSEIFLPERHVITDSSSRQPKGTVYYDYDTIEFDFAIYDELYHKQS